MTKQELIHFEPTAIATFGNDALRFVLTHELRKEAAEAELADAGTRERVIDAEFVRVAMWLHNEERIDLFKAYGNKKDNAALYNGILVELGIIEEHIEGEAIVRSFTDPELEGAYSFKQAIASYKQGDEDSPRYTPEQVAAEKVKRSRRNSLNMRLQRVAKAALELVEAKASPDDIKTVEKDDGSTAIVLTKGPKTVMGKEKEVEIASGNTPKMEGAEFTPTITGLAKAADARHKEEPVSKQAIETSNKASEDTSVEQNFLALANAFLGALNKREGTFTDPEKQVMKNMLTELKKYVK